MTLQELAYKEDELYSKIADLYHQHQTEETKKKLRVIFLEYKKVHQTYSELSSNDIEALKRGLFIQWYRLVEPLYLIGISELDNEAENKILTVLNELIETKKIDNELIWMINYYSNWDWVFKRLTAFKGFDKEIVNKQNNKLPKTIDRKMMAKRGRMGRYWNSKTIFSNSN